MPGTAPRVAALRWALPALLWALLIAPGPAAAASARPTGPVDGPADVALAVGATSAAAAVTGLWLRSRYRRDAPEARRAESGEP
ncbi:hypothetical protein ABZ128_19015 [Streptomyces sp. NPDC006326]|uniref:hypothetical protein n=1 Tax=Streptomyces sp. NPDC006326 TaxID=3156752 RepID=UPI0033ACBE32